jgi:hypothetical protein
MRVKIISYKYSCNVWYAQFIGCIYNVIKLNGYYQLAGGNKLYIREDDCRPLKSGKRSQQQPTAKASRKPKLPKR